MSDNGRKLSDGSWIEYTLVLCLILLAFVPVLPYIF